MVVLDTDHLSMLERGNQPTRKLADFSRVSGLRVDDWTA
jgi:hypothetical protein